MNFLELLFQYLISTRCCFGS